MSAVQLDVKLDTISEFSIGRFGDLRLDRIGAAIFKAICEIQTVCIRKLAGGRAQEVRFGRFLRNKKVTQEAINLSFLQAANENCAEIEHALCLQDTVTLGYPSQPIKKGLFGTTTHEDTQGILMHSGVLLNAENKEVIGVVHLNPWTRSNEEKTVDNKRPIEEKESYKWLNCAKAVCEQVMTPKRLTFVCDRESDIYEFYACVEEHKRDFIVRARHDRTLTSGKTISEHFSGITKIFIHTVELPRNRNRKKTRTATLEIKYSLIELKEKDGQSLKMYCVCATEIGPVPKGEERVSWVLLTSHAVNTDAMAIKVLTWYTWRWTIEEIHRTMKNKGMKIEDSQIVNPDELLTMAMLCFAGAARVMVLVQSRNGNTQKVKMYFTEDEISFLGVVEKTLEGKTEKQKNRHPKNTMGWAAWIIARLGGWKGYASECPPGPITMRYGLERFCTMCAGWCLSLGKKMCA